MSGRLQELWEGVTFWCLIMALIVLALIVFVDPFGWQDWLRAHRPLMAVVGILATLAAIVLGARRK